LPFPLPLPLPLAIPSKLLPEPAVGLVTEPIVFVMPPNRPVRGSARSFRMVGKVTVLPLPAELPLPALLSLPLPFPAELSLPFSFCEGTLVYASNPKVA
jgi:hypothetical protein